MQSIKEEECDGKGIEHRGQDYYKTKAVLCYSSVLLLYSTEQYNTAHMWHGVVCTVLYSCLLIVLVQYCFRVAQATWNFAVYN